MQVRKQVLFQSWMIAYKSYQKYKPRNYCLLKPIAKVFFPANAIITGYPKMIDSKSDFTGLILIPIMAGKAMTFIPVPIIEKYDIYEIRDEASSDTFLIAHAKDSEKLPEQKIKVAGVLKELKMKKDDESSAKKVLGDQLLFCFWINA